MAVLSGVVSDDCWVKFVQGEGSLPYYAPKGVLLREIEDLRRKAISSFYLSYSYLKQRFLTPNSIGEVLGFPYFLYLVGRFSPDFP
jgi:hypothetical protein